MLYRKNITSSNSTEISKTELEEIKYYKVNFEVTKPLSRLIRAVETSLQGVLLEYTEIERGAKLSSFTFRNGLNTVILSINGLEVYVDKQVYGESFVDRIIERYNTQFKPKLKTSYTPSPLPILSVQEYRKTLEQIATKQLEKIKKQIEINMKKRNFFTRFICIDDYLATPIYGNEITLRRYKSSFINNFLESASAKEKWIYTEWEGKYYVSLHSDSSIEMIANLKEKNRIKSGV